ncbi:MAG: hypothetical protein ACI9GW_003730 [Halieaceae bacterium]
MQVLFILIAHLPINIRYKYDWDPALAMESTRMKLIISLLFLLLLQACKHPLAIIGQGDIVDLNGGVFGCTYEEFQADEVACENDVQDDYYVNYQAVPHVGWQFSHWDGACGHFSEGENCRFEVDEVLIAYWDANIEEVIEPLTAVFVAIDTAGVLCDYSDTTLNSQASLTYTSTSQWTCTDTTRELTANGIPDHDVGAFPNANNPNTISEQTVSASYPLTPDETTSATPLGGPAGTTGYVLNGIKIDAGTAGSCDDSGTSCSLIGNSGSWSIEALGQTAFDFGTDDNNAHVQPGGVYHYHGMPEGFISKQGGNSSTMTIIGWAADGFPVYARYGYSVAGDATSTLKSVTGSYQLVGDVSGSRPSTDSFPLGTFSQDWEYVEGSGDLDECNGRMGVTPEFPAGIYHYFATDSYPYLQRCVKGEVEVTGGMPPFPQ